jgi:hypothetical protein
VNSSQKIGKLKGYHYNWIAEDKDDTIQTGLIAQEVQALFPELVSTDEDGYLSVNYIGLIPHLIEAVKDLQRENDTLKTSGNDYAQQIASIEAKLNLILAGNSATPEMSTEE